MRKVTVMLDPVKYNHKPSSNTLVKKYYDRTKKRMVDVTEIMEVNINLTKNQVEVEYDDFEGMVSNGHAWTVAHFKESEEDNKLHRKIVNFKGMDLLALDFDSGFTPEEFKEKSFSLGLKWTTIYSSMSDSNKLRKFRVIFLLDRTVTNPVEAQALIDMLMFIFNECDAKCSDLCRLYFGGKGLINHRDSIIGVEDIVRAFCIKHCRQDIFNHPRNIISFCKNHRINMINGKPMCVDIDGGHTNTQNSQNLNERDKHYYISNSKCHENSNLRTFACKELSVSIDANLVYEYDRDGNARKRKINGEKSSNKTVKTELNRDINCKDLTKNCAFLNLLSQGLLYPFEDEWFGIALNLLTIRGGEKFLKESVDIMPAPDNVKNSYVDDLQRIKDSYPNGAMKCEKFCPYKRTQSENENIRIHATNRNNTRIEDFDVVEACSCCKNCGSTPLTAITKRRTVRAKEQPQFAPLAEVRNELQNLIKTLADSSVTGKHLILSDTGSGKTHGFIELAKQGFDFSGYMFALPTKKVALEKYEEFKEIIDENKICYIPDLEIEDTDILKEYEELSALGLWGDAVKALEAYSDSLDNEYIKIIHSLKIIDAEDLGDKINELPQVTREKLQSYVRQRKNIATHLSFRRIAKETKDMIITTHARCLNINNKNIHTVVFDEDVFLSYLFVTIPLEEIYKDLKSIGKAGTFKALDADSQLYNALESLKEDMDVSYKKLNTITDRGCMRITKQLKKEIKEFTREHRPSYSIYELLKIKKLLVSTPLGNKKSKFLFGAYIREIKDKKTIILSATANPTMYKLFDSNFVVHNLNHIELHGKLINVADRTYSKESIKNQILADNKIDLEKLQTFNNKIIELSGTRTVITTKWLADIIDKYKDKLENPMEVAYTFGNVAGFNTLKGKDFAVVGVFNANNMAHHFLYNYCSKMLSIKSSINPAMEEITIIRNGFETELRTYVDVEGNADSLSAKLMQEIQFYLIESQLIQAIGRGRLSEHYNKVTYFGNYPVPGMEVLNVKKSK